MAVTLLTKFHDRLLGLAHIQTTTARPTYTARVQCQPHCGGKFTL